MSQELTLREALISALEWIDAVPANTPLPGMPGFDRDEVDALLARTHQPEADPIAEGIRAVSASARKSADDGAWKKLFWEVARLLNCLPSSFVDSNDHVLKKARELVVAQQPAQVVPEDVPGFLLFSARNAIAKDAGVEVTEQTNAIIAATLRHLRARGAGEV